MKRKKKPSSRCKHVKTHGPSRLWVIRHGQSKANVARDEATRLGADFIDIDVPDKAVPLSDYGHRQAAALGRWFKKLPSGKRPDVILVSPYLRAIQTADDTLDAAGIDKAEVEYFVDERLREKSYGILDGLTKVGIRKRFPEEALRFKRDGKFYCQPPGGESWCDVILRLRSLRNELDERFPGKRIAIFAHQVVVQCWRYIEEGLSAEEIIAADLKADVPNCGVVSYKRSKKGRMKRQLLYFEAPMPEGDRPSPNHSAPNAEPESGAGIVSDLQELSGNRDGDTHLPNTTGTLVPVSGDPPDSGDQEIKNMTERKSPLYPAIEPFCTGRLKVSDLHTIYFEEAGNPYGIPVVFVHGGPGGGITASYRQYFDPEKYRIILFDQRGCGKSTPYASLEENTTWDLVEDMEKLRQHFGIDKWVVFGGSWGSTLSLAYAETHPERVLKLFLRGIFLVRKKEIDWFYQNGASEIFPDAWEHYLAAIPEAERGDLLAAYHKRLTSDDPAVRIPAARAWSIWEGSTSKLYPDTNLIGRFGDETFAEAFARIECHYFVNRGFMRSDAQLLEDVHKIRHIPTFIVNGRYDVVCPITSAWDLHRAFPEAEFVIVPDAGHSMHEPGIAEALIKATDAFAAGR